jgi:hypothetical protein
MYLRFAPATEDERRNVYTLPVRNTTLERQTMKVDYQHLKYVPWIKRSPAILSRELVLKKK